MDMKQNRLALELVRAELVCDPFCLELLVLTVVTTARVAD
jgi:hypothetical protein